MNTPTSAEIRRARWRRFVNRAFLVACVATSLVSVVILGVLIASIVSKGAGHLNWNFFTNYPSRHAGKAGLKVAIWGSIAICTVCALAALPLGVGTAVFLEEFKSRRPVVRRIHSFVDLNIRNLAGIPSIVYGMIGMTVFVQMFGAFGNLNEPGWTFGQSWHDEFITTSGEPVYESVRRADDPPALFLPGTTASLTTWEGRSVEVAVLGTTDNPPDDEATLAIYAADPPNRIDRKHWYYLQLPFGRGVLTGGLTLMLVILPVVIIATSEALRAVPNSLREGALAAGATRWQMVWRMTLPCAIPGIMTGSILAMGRAIGEAAPILIIAGGLVFITFTPEHLMDDFTAMPLQIYNWASRPQEEFHELAATGIIVLLSVLILFNLVAAIIRHMFQKPLQ